MKLLSEYFDQKDAKIFQYIGLIIIGIAVVYSIFGGRGELTIATVSIGLGMMSLGIAISSEKRMKELEKKEIQKKLIMFKEENMSNIDLIDNLIGKKDNFYSQQLLDKKLKQKPSEKYIPTPEEQRILHKGGLWIPKDDFSYNYAFQVIEIGHHFDNKFIKEIKKYIEDGRHLNAHKDFCQLWIIARRNANPDEVKNYFNALDKAKESSTNMMKLIDEQTKEKKIEI